MSKILQRVFQNLHKERDVFTQAQKSASGGATWAEIGNPLENFKTDMMSSISSQLDVLREKQRQAEEDLALGVFRPKCRTKQLLRECPLDKVQEGGLCDLDHDTKECPSLLKVKTVFQASIVHMEQTYFISQKKS